MAGKRKTGTALKKPKQKCRFRQAWMHGKDSKGHPHSDWLERYDEEHAFCKLCKCTIKFSVVGVQAFSHHAGTTKHIANLKPHTDPRQLHLEGVSPRQVERTCATDAPTTTATCTSGSNPSSALPTLQLYSVRRKSTMAEIYWGLKCVASEYSASSCDGIKDIFSVMFEDSQTLPNFSFSRTKFTYILTDGLAPYFREELEADMCGQYYTLYYDETTNEAGSKELRTGVRYWSQREHKIRSAYLRTFFIGKASGEVISENILSAIDKCSLPLSKLVMLGSDGPTVNAKVHRLVNEKVKECRGKPLLDLGTCNIHIVHNAFSAGLGEFGDDVGELVILVHQFFDGWPSRWEDYETIQTELNLPSHRFIKHVSSRWLTLEHAADRIIEQWSALKKYFVDFIPKNRPKLAARVGYTKIKGCLNSNTMRAKLIFVRNSANMFAGFTKSFQKEEPLIHILHTELRTLAYTILNRVCKPEVIKDRGVCLSSLNEENLIPAEKIVVGDDVAAELADPDLDVREKNRQVFYKNARDHYVAACKHLLRKSALKAGTNVRYYRCLQPKERLSEKSCSDVLKIAKDLPVPINSSRLFDEWKLLQLEEDAPGSSEKSVDVYWSQFFELKKPIGNDLKYPNVTAVVKTALCLSHGQADVERGFSESGRTLTRGRASMGERTLDAYMVVKNALRDYDNRPHLVPVTSKLITKVEGAHAKYQSYKEEEKKKKELELQNRVEEENKRLEELERKNALQKNQKRIIEEEEKLKEERAAESKKRKTSQKLLDEGNSRLKSSLEQNDLEGASYAQALIEAAKKKQEEAHEHHKVVTAMQKELDRKKTKLITDISKGQN